MQSLGSDYKSLGNMSPEEWQNFLNQRTTGLSRLSQLQQASQEAGNKFAAIKADSNSNSDKSSTPGNSLFGSSGDLSNVTGTAKDLAEFNQGLNQKQGTFDLGLREQEAQSNFGRTKDLRGIDYTNTYNLAGQQIQAQKDFKGIDYTNTYNLAGQQIDAQKQFKDLDFGYNYKLGDQQITGQKDITNLQQNATTDRLQRQLDTQKGMQQSGFDQQNLYRAQSAALALRGLR